jgi:hypothetical protein
MPQPRAIVSLLLASRKPSAIPFQRSRHSRVLCLEALESRALLTPNPLVDPVWMQPPPTGVPPYVIYGIEPNPNPGDPDPDPMNSDPRVDMTTPDDQALIENMKNWSDGSASTGDLWLAAIPIEPTDAYA